MPQILRSWWDNLILPEGWAEILAVQPDELHAVPPILEQCPPLCFCGLRHLDPSPCHRDAACNFHNYLESHCCPAIPVHSLGCMSRVCPHCHASFFASETLNCCMRGSVSVPIAVVPARMTSIITSPAILKNIRAYNMALSMASTGHANLSPGWGMFVLGGKVYHRMSARFESSTGTPCFAQIYMLDTAAATARRLSLFQGGRNNSQSLDAQHLAQLHDLLLSENPWIRQYRSAGLNVTELTWHSLGRVSLDGMGLGAMVDGSGSRNIVIRFTHNGEDVIRNIDDDHELYHPLAYVLLFPTGIGGWASGMCRKHIDGSDTGKLTLTKWARFIIQRRVEGLTHLQSCGSLTSEFWCDVWAQVEAKTLAFLRHPQQQAKIRAGRFCNVADSIKNSRPLHFEGTPVMMPTSFMGSASWYRALYHDAMALPVHFGRPDIFLTMTCNPRWPEIQDNLPAGADPLEHSDLVARVFYSKWMALLHDITHGHIFGEVLGFCWRVEWQFRGWPHVHAMLILRRKMLSAQQIDGVVSAEIPDPVKHPELYHVVKEFMVHGPFCGEAHPVPRCCQNDAGRCRFRFPKSPQAETVICSNQFPLYRRRQLFTAVVRGQSVSDNWIAPYNGLLLLRYRCHICIEICTHLKVTKYCYKYVFKRPDEAAIGIDEIDLFLTRRVLSVGEAVWRILGLRLHQEHPPVHRLDLHLPHQHRVTFDTGDSVTNPQDAWSRIEEQTTTLLQWFRLNGHDTAARQFKYSEIPRHYVWKDSAWHPRRRDTNSIGRMHVVGADDSELFHLRRLLCIVKGATCFDDVKTVMGITYPSFKEACAARGMLLDDAEYVAAMQDMCDTECSVDAIRRQYAFLLVHCRPTNAKAIFEMFLPELCGCEQPQQGDIQCCLWALANSCNALGRTLEEFGFELPDTPMMTDYPSSSDECLRLQLDRAFAQFSAEQATAAAQIIQAVEKGQGGLFYVQASGGCGKSFWANGVGAALRVAGYKTIAVAASGLAATVLEGGRTAHSVFGIPIDVDENSWCSCDQAARAAIVHSDIVFWDECSMLHVDAANCVNRSLQDWTKSPMWFGGKVVVFMGDFQQLLPVVRGGSGDSSTIMQAEWWSHVTILRFTRNYRSDDADYCDMLHQVGTGAWTEVAIPHERVTADIDELCERVFGDIRSTQDVNSHIVTLTLDDAAKINSHVIAKLPGPLVMAAAADVKINCKDPDLYSDEFVHSLMIPGAPPAVLELKEGARYMFSRNLDQQRGLVNGVQVVCTAIRSHTVTVRLPSGQCHVIPRINFTILPSVSGLPFALTRRQYPLIPAYVLTAHRVQGQTLARLGLYFTGDAFCHGLLFTALSRVRSWLNITVWREAGAEGACILRNLVRSHIVAHLRIQ